MRHDVPEERETLWRLAASPVIWAAHFLLSYAVAAVYCAKYAPPDAPLGPVRVVIVTLSAVALLAIGLIGWSASRRHRLAGGTGRHDADTPEDRHRFLGLATLLLSGLSAIAIVYAALVMVFVRSCR